MDTIKIRANLKNFKRGISNGNLSIGFAGGSITTASNSENWPTHLRGWLVSAFPNVHFRINNAAIGATGSLCGLALAQKEFIDSKYDLVFIEYAVNDHSIDREERMRTREGLIRKLMAADIDVVLVYTYFSEMYDNELPQSIADFEQLAKHYKISSVNMAKPVYNMVSDGMMPINMWLPDGTHPQAFGSYLYASEVIRFLKAELAKTIHRCAAAVCPNRSIQKIGRHFGKFRSTAFIQKVHGALKRNALFRGLMKNSILVHLMLLFHSRFRDGALRLFLITGKQAE